MIGILVLTHGNLAGELVAAAATISGREPPCEALPLDWRDTLDVASEKVAAALERLDRGEGVLILTDLVGDTPFNAARRFLAPGRVEIVSGVNLPMVLRLSCLPQIGPQPAAGRLAQVAQWIRQKGQAAICVVSDNDIVTATGSLRRPQGDPAPEPGC